MRMLFPQVSPIFFVLCADVFDQIAVRDQPDRCLQPERPSVVFRIVEGELQVHMSEVAAVKPLSYMHVLAERGAQSVAPTSNIKPAPFEHPPIALPYPDR